LKVVNPDLPFSKQYQVDDYSSKDNGSNANANIFTRYGGELDTKNQVVKLGYEKP